MQQSNYIFGIILFAFIIFITAKGELPTYIAFLKGGGQQGSNAGSSTGENAVSGGFNSIFGGSSAAGGASPGDIQ